MYLSIVADADRKAHTGSAGYFLCLRRLFYCTKEGVGQPTCQVGQTMLSYLQLFTFLYPNVEGYLLFLGDPHQ